MIIIYRGIKIKQIFFSLILVFSLFITSCSYSSIRLVQVNRDVESLDSEYNLSNIENHKEQVYLNFYQFGNRKGFTFRFSIRAESPINELYIESLNFYYNGKIYKEKIERQIPFSSSHETIFDVGDNKKLKTFFVGYFPTMGNREIRVNILSRLKKEKENSFPVMVEFVYSINGSDSQVISKDFIAYKYIRDWQSPLWLNNVDGI